MAEEDEEAAAAEEEDDDDDDDDDDEDDDDDDMAAEPGASPCPCAASFANVPSAFNPLEQSMSKSME